MSIGISRLPLLSLAAMAIAVGMVSSTAAQPLQPPAEEPERRPAQPEADREPGYLGLITDDRREQGQGVRVVNVVEGAPAAAAGFEENDLIVAIDGNPVGSLDDMAAQLQHRSAGDKVRFEIRRGDAMRTIEVALGRRPARGERPFEFGRIPEHLPEPNGVVPPADEAPPALPGAGPLAQDRSRAAPRGQLLGIRTAAVTEEFRQRMRLPQAAGARVVSRVVGSPADRAGIPLEAVIVAVDDQPVGSPADLAQLIAAAGAGKEVALTYYSGGEQRQALVTLAEVAPPAQLDPGPFGQPRFGPRPFDGQIAPPPNAAERIEQLERRIRELEQRVQQLERALKD